MKACRRWGCCVGGKADVAIAVSDAVAILRVVGLPRKGSSLEVKVGLPRKGGSEAPVKSSSELPRKGALSGRENLRLRHVGNGSSWCQKLSKRCGSREKGLMCIHLAVELNSFAR